MTVITSGTSETLDLNSDGIQDIVEFDGSELRIQIGQAGGGYTEQSVSLSGRDRYTSDSTPSFGGSYVEIRRDISHIEISEDLDGNGFLDVVVLGRYHGWSLRTSDDYEDYQSGQGFEVFTLSGGAASYRGWWYEAAHLDNLTSLFRDLTSFADLDGDGRSEVYERTISQAGGETTYTLTMITEFNPGMVLNEEITYDSRLLPTSTSGLDENALRFVSSAEVSLGEITSVLSHLSDHTGETFYDNLLLQDWAQENSDTGYVTVDLDQIMEFGSDANDRVYLKIGSDIYHAGAGNDTVIGSAGSDIAFGGDGNDYMVLKRGRDIAHGGEGNDRIFGSKGQNTIYGDSGDDYLHTGDHSSKLYGGTGDDTLVARTTNSHVFHHLTGGEGADTFVFTSANPGKYARAKIYDFDASEDSLVIGGTTIDLNNLGDGMSSEMVDGDLVLSYGDNDSIIFADYDLALT